MIKIVVEKGFEESFECECCGSYTPEYFNLYVNNELIWESYNDNHLKSVSTDEWYVTSLLNAYKKHTILAVEQKYKEDISKLSSEEQNKDLWVVKDRNTWLTEQKEGYIDFFNFQMGKVEKALTHLPMNQELGVKMVALWIEEYLEVPVEVEVRA